MGESTAGSFPAYFVSQYLQAMGWPKSKGLLKQKRWVPGWLVVRVFEQLVQLGCGLGAGRPSLGTQLIGDVFVGNPWTDQSTEELVSQGIGRALLISSRADIVPWKILVREGDFSAAVALVEAAPEFEWEGLTMEGIATAYSAFFAQGVYWGLTHPDEMARWLKRESNQYEGKAPDAIRHGLTIEPTIWSSPDDFYTNCEDIVSNFQAERRALAPTPESLANRPEIAVRIE